MTELSKSQTEGTKWYNSEMKALYLPSSSFVYCSRWFGSMTWTGPASFELVKTCEWGVNTRVLKTSQNLNPWPAVSSQSLLLPEKICKNSALPTEQCWLWFKGWVSEAPWTPSSLFHRKDLAKSAPKVGLILQVVDMINKCSVILSYKAPAQCQRSLGISLLCTYMLTTLLFQMMRWAANFSYNCALPKLLGARSCNSSASFAASSAPLSLSHSLRILDTLHTALPKGFFSWVSVTRAL